MTFYNVCEALQSIPVSAIQQAMKPEVMAAGGLAMSPPTPIRFVSVWMREDSDQPSAQFEHEYVFHLPGNNEIVAGQTPFSFTKARFHRLMSPPVIVPGIPSGGVLKIESRVRRKGEEAWIGRQFFYIELLSIEAPNQPAEKKPEA
jgi:hypothetical protein